MKNLWDLVLQIDTDIGVHILNTKFKLDSDVNK